MLVTWMRLCTIVVVALVVALGARSRKSRESSNSREYEDSVDYSTVTILEKQLQVPSWQNIAEVVSQGLQYTFRRVEVAVRPCPDLTRPPYNLRAPGLSGNVSLVEIGGLPYLFPLVQRDKVYDLARLARHLRRDSAFLCGAGAGPWPHLGRNSEAIINMRIQNGTVRQGSRVAWLKPGVGRRGPECKLDELPDVETRTALFGSYLLSNGDPGDVIVVKAEQRIGSSNFIFAIRDALSKTYSSQLIGLGGVFVLKAGRAQYHVMPDFPTEPLSSPLEIEEWLHYLETSAPVVHVGTLVAGELEMDLLPQHFHGWGEAGVGGHYHYDTTPEQAIYEGYFVPFSSVVRVDPPQNEFHLNPGTYSDLVFGGISRNKFDNRSDTSDGKSRIKMYKPRTQKESVAESHMKKSEAVKRTVSHPSQNELPATEHSKESAETSPRPMTLEDAPDQTRTTRTLLKSSRSIEDLLKRLTEDASLKNILKSAEIMFRGMNVTENSKSMPVDPKPSDARLVNGALPPLPFTAPHIGFQPHITRAKIVSSSSTTSQSVEYSRVSIHEAPLHVPPLQELVNVLSYALQRNYHEVSVSVVRCPDLRRYPFNLTSPGLSGNVKLIDVGSTSYLFPMVQRDKVYDLAQLTRHLRRNPAFLCGAGAGPWRYMGRNSEAVINLSVRNGKVNQGSRVVWSEPSTSSKGSSRCQVARLSTSETRTAFFGSYLLSDGKPGPVIMIRAKRRKGSTDLISAIRKALFSQYGARIVGLGGVFLLHKGLARYQVRTEFANVSHNSQQEMKNMLRYFNVPSPTLNMGTLVSGDLGVDMSMQRFHGWGAQGGGHYEGDTLPDLVQYEGYFVPAASIIRVDPPVDPADPADPAYPADPAVPYF